MTLARIAPAVEEVGAHLGDNVASLVVLLFTAAVVSMLIRRTPIPFSVALVATGIGLQQLPMAHTLAQFRLSPEAILFIFLPTLLFAAAFEIDGRRFLEVLPPVLTLAVPGVLLCAAVVAAVMVGGAGLALPVALLFGAVVSATDPVAVLALFRELGVSKRLSMLMDGESLLNDGTALVLFQTLLAIVLAGTALTGSTLALAVWQFALVSLGGALAGAALAWLMTLLLARTQNALVEITLAVILAYGTFIVADHYLHVSGVIATITAGLVLGNYGRTKITPTSLEAVEAFWSYAGFAAEALLFLLVGLTVSLLELLTQWSLLVWAVVAVLLSRAATIYLLVPTINLAQAEKIDWRFQTVMFWGGLRGAVAIAIALGLPETFPEKDLLLALTLGVVLFTLFVNAFTIRPLVQRMGLHRLTSDELLQRRAGLLVARAHAATTLQRLASEGVLSRRISDELQARYLDEVRDGGSVASATSTFDAEQMHRVLMQHCLLVERREYERLFAEGDVDEGTLKDLTGHVEDELDTLRGSGSFASWRSWVEGWSRPLRTVVARLPFLQPMLSELGARRILRFYEMGRAQLLAFRKAEEALQNLEESAAMEAAVLERVRTTYDARRQRIEARLEQIGDQFPEFAEKVQGLIAARFRLAAEVSAFRELHEAGLVTEKVLGAVEDEIAAQERSLRTLRPDALLRQPEELVRGVPFLAELQDAVVAAIAALLIPRAFLDGDEIMREGEPGHSLYFIGRGLVEVFTQDQSGQRIAIALLRAGEVVGEMALLTSRPRVATATALTPCNLLQLRRSDLERILRQTPDLHRVLEDAYRTRVGLAILSHLPSLAGLSQDEREQLAANLEGEWFPGGEVRLGDSLLAALYIVRSGEIEVGYEDGNAQILREGDAFGGPPLFPTHPKSMRSRTDSELLVLRRAPPHLGAAQA